MNEKILDIAAFYGPFGLISLALAVYIYYLHKQHAQERREWLELVEKYLVILNEIKGLLTNKK